MEHILRISVSEEPASGGIVSCRHISVRELLAKHGADKLSEIDPAEYAALLAEAEVL